MPGSTFQPSWECGGCKAIVPSGQVTGSFFRGQAVCTDCEELFMDEAGVNQAMMAKPRGVRGPHPQAVFMDEVAEFGSALHKRLEEVDHLQAKLADLEKAEQDRRHGS